MRSDNCAGFTPVTPARPCPACGKTDWCSFTADGSAVICMRRESHRVTQNGGWLHPLDEDRPPPNQTPAAQGKPVKTAGDWPKTMADSATRLDKHPELRLRLAADLGLPVEAFEGFHIGVLGIEKGLTQYAVAERDGWGFIIGISTRAK